MNRIGVLFLCGGLAILAVFLFRKESLMSGDVRGSGVGVAPVASNLESSNAVPGGAVEDIGNGRVRVQIRIIPTLAD